MPSVAGGSHCVTPQIAVPGTRGVNFAESGARVADGPTPPATHPLSLTQQVAEFQNYVTTGAVSFNPSSTLFMLLGGLNFPMRCRRGMSTEEVEYWSGVAQD